MSNVTIHDLPDVQELQASGVRSTKRPNRTIIQDVSLHAGTKDLAMDAVVGGATSRLLGPSFKLSRNNGSVVFPFFPIVLRDEDPDQGGE
jgi:hypothetical protein